VIQLSRIVLSHAHRESYSLHPVKNYLVTYVLINMHVAGISFSDPNQACGLSSPKQACDGNVLIDLGPVNAMSAPD
jgi:hypothetical protein